MPEISIIVPVYNVENYLHRCVDSILAQTFSDFELLLIDDGSPDNSGAICDEYAAKDSRVRVFHKENGGVSSARNLGLDNARGEYIMFCDSDDYVAENWAERLYSMMTNHAVDIAMCGIQTVENGECGSKCKFSDDDSCILTLNQLYEIVSSALLAVVWNKIWKKDLIIQAELRFKNNISCNEDAIFFLEYMQNCSNAIGIDNHCTYCYVKGIEGSLSVKYHPHYWDTKKYYFTQLKAALEHCVGAFDDFKTVYYSDMITGIAATLNKILSPSNPNGFLCKLKEGNDILHSDECKRAFEEGRFIGFHPWYKRILEMRSMLAVYAFHCMVEVKHRWKGVSKCLL